MTRTATRPKPMSAEEAAGLLFERAVGMLTVATDHDLARVLADALIASGVKLGAAPNDYDAVRAELRRLWGISEAREHSLLCDRYRPSFMPARVQ